MLKILGLSFCWICTVLPYLESEQGCSQKLDGKYFKMSEWEIGVTAPPFHVYCRSTTVPYFDDGLGSIGGRAARGDDGKTYYVLSDMTYKEWHKSFVDGDKTGFEEYKDHGIKHFKRRDTVNYLDITNEWTKRDKNGTVEEKRLYIANGANYTMDGKHVILKPFDKERAVAAVLCGHYGKAVELVPQILYPQGIQAPDYLIDGKRFDLKCFKCFKKSNLQTHSNTMGDCCRYRKYKNDKGRWKSRCMR